MAPATRMSGNFAASQSANLDHILENFNQFKRKHITQNRDIIKTNALAQLRIKELEDKVLQLEGERAEKNLELIRVRANMDRVERASKSVMRGWQLVGAGLAALNAIEGLRIAEPSDRVEQEAKDIIRGDTNQTTKQSTRIVLDPHALPAGVARNVSRPPEAQLVNLAEEESRELRGEEEEGEGDDDDEEQGIDTIEVEENGTINDETRGTIEDETIRLDASNTSEEQSAKFAPPQASSPIPPSTRPIEQRQYLTVQSRSQLRHSTSIDSLSSFADEEEVQLSDDLCEGQDPLESLLISEKKEQHAESIPKSEPVKRPVKARKRRESTLSPNQSVERSTSAPAEDYHSSLLSGSDEEFSQQQQQSTRSSRRSSARDRKSINYALPKLNTKMRKPDPADMIPAQVGETRRGEGEEEGAGTSNQDTKEKTPKRGLRGGSGVASTGNLREIANMHQSARKEDKGSDAKVLQQQGATPTQKRSHVRRRSSEGRPSSRCSMGADDGNDEWEAERSMSEGEDTSSDLGKGRGSIPTALPASWKANPHRPSSSHLSSKSAVNGTPIPRSQSGQNIKALKVANRIQKIGVGQQPQFKTDATNAKMNGNGTHKMAAAATAASHGEQVLNSSSKHNQARSAPSPSGENTKRNSLHAAMTLEWESQQHGRAGGFGGAGVTER